MSFNTEIHYDHLQFFVDELKPLEHYKAIEDQLNRFAAAAEKRCADTEMHHFLQPFWNLTAPPSIPSPKWTWRFVSAFFCSARNVFRP